MTRFTKLAIGGILVVAGAGVILVAWANLYNVDYQPRSVLAAVASAGVLAILTGVVLLRRSY